MASIFIYVMATSMQKSKEETFCIRKVQPCDTDANLLTDLLNATNLEGLILRVNFGHMYFQHDESGSGLVMTVRKAVYSELVCAETLITTADRL